MNRAKRKAYTKTIEPCLLDDAVEKMKKGEPMCGKLQ